MLVATVDYIPNRKYEILGVVTGNRIISVFSKTEVNKAIDKLVEEAKSLGASGVIGLKPYTTSNGSTCVIGTAIKFLD